MVFLTGNNRTGQSEQLERAEFRPPKSWEKKKMRQEVFFPYENQTKLEGL